MTVVEQRPEHRPPADLSQYPPPPSDLPVCDTCGEVHYTRDGSPSCIAHRSIDGGACRTHPVTGLTVCRMHGATKAARAVGQRRHATKLAEEKAAKSLAHVDVTPIGNPVDHLAELAAEALALKSHFADVVATLRHITDPTRTVQLYDARGLPVGELFDERGQPVRPVDHSEGDTRDAHGYRFTDDKGGEQLDARVALYERAMERAHKFLLDLTKIGFEERRIGLEEQRVQLVHRFLGGILAGLGHDLNEPRVRGLIELWAPVLDGQDPGIIDVEEHEEVALPPGMVPT